MMTQAGFKQLMADEGFRAFVYDDESGLPIKYGSQGGVPTIGYGRNLVTRGISQQEGIFLLTNDLNQVWALLTRDYPWCQQIDPVWQDVMIMVAFNVGNVAVFTKFLAALQAGFAKTAHDELLDSKAAVELPARYGRMAEAIINKAW